MLITTRRCPVLSARYWTVDVLPVPVSPTSNTGSFHATQHATRSSKHAAGRVKEKLDPLVALNNINTLLQQQCNSVIPLRSSTEQKVSHIFKKIRVNKTTVTDNTEWLKIILSEFKQQILINNKSGQSSTCELKASSWCTIKLSASIKLSAPPMYLHASKWYSASCQTFYSKLWCTPPTSFLLFLKVSGLGRTGSLTADRHSERDQQ